jgi:putative phosphoesterase
LWEGLVGSDLVMPAGRKPSRESTAIGVISDVHADLAALQTALAHFDEVGVDMALCAGDLVDSGDQPEHVIALLRERGIPTVKGNHDAWAVTRHHDGRPAHLGLDRPQRLSADAVSWLSELPVLLSVELEGVRVALAHGTPLSFNDSIWPDEDEAELTQWLAVAQADILIIGHTHMPFERRVGDGLVVNPGALWRDAGEHGQYLNRPARRGGCFGVMEVPARRWVAELIGR